MWGSKKCSATTWLFVLFQSIQILLALEAYLSSYDDFCWFISGSLEIRVEVCFGYNDSSTSTFPKVYSAPWSGAAKKLSTLLNGVLVHTE